jgi:hypothetical protein
MTTAVLEYPNVRGVGSRVARALEQKIQQPNTSLMEKLMAWSHLLLFVEATEEILLDDPDNKDLLDQHKKLLDVLILLGQDLADSQGLATVLQNILNCTPADFNAKIEMLENKRSMWHHDLTPEQAENIIQSVFYANA